MNKFQKAVNKINSEAPEFVLLNLNSRPVFARPLYLDEITSTGYGGDGVCAGCGKKAVMVIYEIDKEIHYSNWSSCGSSKCDAG